MSPSCSLGPELWLQGLLPRGIIIGFWKPESVLIKMNKEVYHLEELRILPCCAGLHRDIISTFQIYSFILAFTLKSVVRKRWSWRLRDPRGTQLMFFTCSSFSVPRWVAGCSWLINRFAEIHSISQKPAVVCLDRWRFPQTVLCTDQLCCHWTEFGVILEYLWEIFCVGRSQEARLMLIKMDLRDT
jgi:hypothetical protein